MSNDMVDHMLASIAGLDEVGLDEIGELSDEEVGAKVKRAARKARNVQPSTSTAAPGAFVRSSRDVLRRAPGGFPMFSLAAAIGATTTQSIKTSRPTDITRLVAVPSGPGIVMDSLKIGDEEQLLTSGVPVEMYGATVYDQRADNFTTLPAGIDLTIQLRNTTVGALTCNIGFKGEVRR
jgi:hypothetical protein